MPPLNLIVHADSPENAARIERALRTGAPACTIVCVHDRAQLADALAHGQADGAIALQPESAGAKPPAGQIDPSLRHELNNHLALIRMLADYLVDGAHLPAADTARIREIASAAEGAAQALRRSKGLSG